MSSDAVIRASGLGKAYALYHSPVDWLRDLVARDRRRGGEFWALRDVDLTVGRGETVGIIGPNGSGKSTLLQLVCGTLWPSTGTLGVSGRVAALLELGAGFNPEFTGRENVYLNASVLGLSDATIAARLPEIEAFAEIGEFIDRPVREYSSGMYARLAFAVIAHVDADILIVDEILSVGDISFQQKCMRFLRDFRRRGTLLFVSHDEAAVLSLCERAVWLDGGRVQADGAAGGICRRYHTSQARRMAASEQGFRTGGRPRLARPGRERLAGGKKTDLFSYDADADWQGEGGAQIEAAGFCAPGGEALAVAQGGEDVELRVVCRAERALATPIVAFVVRNRLGQAVFGDNSYHTARGGPRPVAAGARFTTTFRFDLPYLPTGDYVVEALLFDGTAEDYTPLARRLEARFLRIHSVHVGGGLANIGTSETRLDLGPDPRLGAAPGERADVV